MQNLDIEKTNYTPGITFDIKTGKFQIEGRSMPENTVEFFNPVFSVLKRYINEVKKDITVNFKLVYFNSGSSKRILELLRILDDYRKIGGKALVNWYYEEDDEDQLEEGEEFSEYVEIDFEFIPY